MSKNPHAQARIRSPKGRIVKRWRVTLPETCARRVAYTWAASKLEAKMKTRDRRGVDPLTIEPAPEALNMHVRDALSQMVED